MTNSSNPSLSSAQIAVLLRYGVGVGSEGGTNPGLGLAGWVVNGQGRFDSNGNAINASLIIEDSGYSVGTLQTDFGQRSTGPWASGFNAFFNAFADSPQGQALPPSDLSAIKTTLRMNGDQLKRDPSSMLHQTEFNALNSFLLSPAGQNAAQNLDLSVINVTSPTGTNAANRVANSDGDVSAQEIAAAVAMKLYNQAGNNSTELRDFNSWLQDQVNNGNIITSGSIQNWVNTEIPSGALSTGLTNTIQATTTLNALQASSNPTLQAIYAALSSVSDGSPSRQARSDGLYDLGLRLLSVSPAVAHSVMNAISSGTYYQSASSGSINGDGALAAGSYGTIVGADGDVVIWNADGTAFVIQNGAPTQLDGFGAIQFTSAHSLNVVMPDRSTLNLDNSQVEANSTA